MTSSPFERGPYANYTCNAHLHFHWLSGGALLRRRGVMLDLVAYGVIVTAAVTTYLDVWGLPWTAKK
jgi:hypothetical protein